MKMDRRGWVGLGVAVAAGYATAQWLQHRPDTTLRLEATPVVQAVLADRGSPSVGATSPDVTIVVFTDYQCPICRRTDAALARLVARDPEVKVVYKDWPILGEASKEAARTALASVPQGRYAAVHRSLMSLRAPVDPVRVRQAAEQAGVDWARLTADRTRDGTAIDAQLARHSLQAFSLGLEGTPAYLVGPYLVRRGLDDRALATLVAAARRAGPPRKPAG